MRKLAVILVLGILFLVGCSEEVVVKAPLFELKDNATIGIEFSNDLVSTNEFNVYKYRNFYNGGGVGLGDINNDGLVDIYLVSNQEQNKLFINKGDFKFEDITESSGVGGNKAWSTGVTFADVNGDGYLDIYVCNSGDLKGDDKESELFINQQDNTFIEQAEQYGLNDKGYSTHASFFDFDKDGDLDVYLLNNSYAAIGSFNLKKNQRPVRDELGGDRLMRNDGGKFIDVSEEAGIYGSEIGFGLGVTVSDFNNDSWLDIFISNDFFERDYLYMNQGNGTFVEKLTDKMHSTSAASMGADAADINNDGYTDIFVTDMLPYEYERLKTVTTFDDWNRYNYNVDNDYHHQFSRNVLHLNQEGEYFSEISRYMGVHASDWSWGALFFDMDNDGWRDLFIANGIYKDITNQDYIAYVANESIIQSIVSDKGVDYKELIDIIPSNKVKNMAFRNVQGSSFELDNSLGLAAPSFSNGSAFGDLDNDGDLDLVVNNINMSCFVYENNAPSSNKSIQVILEGEGKNKFGIGARVTVTADGQKFVHENITCKGFQSTVDHKLTIGVGTASHVDLVVDWPSRKRSTIAKVTVGEAIIVKEADAVIEGRAAHKLRKPVFELAATLPYYNSERKFSDFNQERLIYWMRNTEGGRMTVGDVNGDKIEDLILPGSKGQSTQVLRGSTGGTYTPMRGTGLESATEPEHVETTLADVDGDGDLDLLAAAGGVEHSKFSPFLVDKLFINSGTGAFTKADKAQSPFPKMSTSTLRAFDFDGDGDKDVLATERIKVAQCGMPCSSYLFENEGKGSYKDVTATHAKGLKEVGMVSISACEDFDNDGDIDVILGGEFMPLTFFENNMGQLVKKSINVDDGIAGIWSSLHTVDIDGDGDLDIIAGNHGENSRFSASKTQPMHLYFGDFDSNGFGEGIICAPQDDGKYYPFALRHHLIDQMKSLKKLFPDFESFKNASIGDIIPSEVLSAATKYEVNNLKTMLLINDGNWNFKSIPLPKEAQFTSVYAIATDDFDHDGDTDIVLGGNLYNVQPEMGIFDASRGVLLANDGALNFVARMNELNLQGEIRDMKVVGGKLIVNTVNDSLKVMTF